MNYGILYVYVACTSWLFILLLFASRWKSNAFTHCGSASLYVGISLPQYMTWAICFFEEPHFECGDLSEIMFQNDPQRDLWKKRTPLPQKIGQNVPHAFSCRYCHSLSIYLVEAAVVGNFVTKLLASLGIKNNWSEECYIELYWGWMFERSLGFTNSTNKTE